MSRQEINSEIQKILSSLPDESMPIVLKYLKEVKEINPADLVLAKNFAKILKEDDNLLRRLAQ